MNDKLMGQIVSALVGGIVGAAVVFFAGGKTKFESLEVANLKITKTATLVNAEGKEDVVIREGSVLANNVILGKKFIGTQYQGHVFVGNRIFTSPDNLMEKPMDQWRFFTEMGSTLDAGGEMIVRSANGANVVGQPVNSGVILRAGFNPNNSPELFAKIIDKDLTLPVPFLNPAAMQARGTAPGAETPGDAVPPDNTTAPEAPKTAEANPGIGEVTQ